MASWIQLSPEIVQYNYLVSEDVARQEGNLFFGTQSHPPDGMDGPWPFLAFLRSPLHPKVVTFSIYTLDGFYIEAEGFDPLKDRGSYLQLKPDARIGLIDLLLRQADQLAPDLESNNPIFLPIEKEQLAYYHIRTEHLPNTLYDFYYQAYNPLIQSSENEITLLGLSTGRNMISPPLNLEIGQLSTNELKNPRFEPFVHSLPRMDLTATGLRELASLLGSWLKSKS